MENSLLTPAEIIQVKRLVFTSVDDCRNHLQTNTYRREILVEALDKSKKFNEITRARLLQSAINKLDRKAQP